jgi:hypothetical protein
VGIGEGETYESRTRLTVDGGYEYQTTRSYSDRRDEPTSSNIQSLNTRIFSCIDQEMGRKQDIPKVHNPGPRRQGR